MMAFSPFSKPVSILMGPDGMPLLSANPAPLYYIVLIINIGVIGLLLYLLAARLNRKAFVMTSLKWKDCEFA